MKKTIITLLIAVFATTAVFAQGRKGELTEKIQEKHQWLYAYAIEKTANINLSESMWEMVLGESRTPKGYSTFKRMGKAFTDISDKFGGTYLEKKCGFNVNGSDEKENRGGCKLVVDGWGDKYSLTVNAQGVQAGSDAFTLVMGYISSVAIYLEDGSASVWAHGYSLKSDRLHIIINADNKYKDMSVKWSADGSTVTISAPGDIQTLDWDGKIEKGLQRGMKQG